MNETCANIMKILRYQWLLLASCLTIFQIPRSFALSEASPRQAIDVTANFSVRLDPPLLKKMSMFNSGLAPIPNYERDVDKLDEIYADSLRVDLGIGARRFFPVDTVQGTPDNLQFDFSKLDRWTELLSRHNVLAYPSWCYIPKPLQKDNNRRTLNTDLTNWQETWRKIHAEYARHFRERGVRIGYHEVYNEPDLPGRGGVFLNNEQFKSGIYFQMYKYGVLGLKDGDPDAVVGGPGYANGRLLGDFVDFVTRENLPLDFLSFHTYTGAGWPQSYQSARAALASNPRYNTVEIHLNEINWLNSSYPDRSKPTSPNNKYEAAARNLDQIYDIVSKTDITMAHWAQFMESTAGDDSYGIIRKDGHKKAAFNAFKIYADMSEDRVAASAGNPLVNIMASTDRHRISTVIWSSDSTDHIVRLKLDNLPFAADEFRLYRIDRNHASYFDGAPEDLEPEKIKNTSEGPSFAWSGVLPSNGVVYFIADDGSANPDFKPNLRDVTIGRIIRTHHYFEYGTGEQKTSFRFFDRRSWRAFLGMGSEKTANSACGVTVENLPEELDIRFHVSGNVQQRDRNSLLGLRVDYLIGRQFVKSVFFHGGIYSDYRDSPWLFGTTQAPDKVVKMNLSQFRIRITDYAPTNWKNGRILISFQMQNTGPNTRAEVKVRPG